MAAMRLALMGLCRRSSAAACGGGLEMRQAFRPAAMRNLEAWRRFSTEGIKGANLEKQLMEHKTERILCMWWQRARETVKVVSERDDYLYVASVCGMILWSGCFMVKLWRLPVTPCGVPNYRTPVPTVNYDDDN